MTFVKNAKPVPATFIPKVAVNERIKNFMNSKHPILTQSIGKAESQSAWYSLEQFEELVREMYYLNADGLRIYFGAYGNDDLDYANQLTVIFVPTQLNPETGKHRDILIEDAEDFEDRAKAEQIYKKSTDMEKGYDTLSLNPPGGIDDECLYPY